MHLFYTPNITPQNDAWFLTEEESKHCARVLRLGQSDQVSLIDGKGGLYTATISDPHPKRTILKIDSVITEYGKRNHYLHMAVAPTKNLDRLEWFLEKATEIGIDEVSLIITQRSERKEAKAERLNKIITSAIKQSLKAYHPILNEAVPFNKFLERPFDGQKFVAHCIDGPKSAIKDLIAPQGNYLVIIGPEGDFTEKEVTDALQSGYKAITLGESRLRTETAALEACFEVNFLNR
ncbi:16S rRNA (uracil(1498)-N(3))-methyltransferase [Mucilaginibacter myungsuensis]|uniref:Ribosomal RNA small subunit methyltransferase E n=1 Tax=Mucilaginibacter myungsuensis TaxID=649104 RepID=A0A929KYK2_9SPHI|nr:16S rRNA (uracil(1498)-N(3))-methyltransferase [Mucilaginibacter myungsuensis]MBE9662303.1 16S rRNA (uracil(1498)-N(3))-methyltransferase [Mucilaginibacter myungsuensis]MDN3599260.1 16S rRNA (uracil(1498)-N(3))-methyltransferase [Mucilaginibacter myungsuensis]